MASKTIAMFKSPHTGNLGESHAGGRSAIAIRMAGYCAIVIRGASSSPVYLVIEGDKVHFRDARAMWGMHSAYPAGSILRERESGAGMRTIMRIGPAGEKGVSYASVVTETYRHFGRLGLGAVFGSKLLKGIVVSGVRSLPVSDPPALPEDLRRDLQGNDRVFAVQEVSRAGHRGQRLAAGRAGRAADAQFAGGPLRGRGAYLRRTPGRRIPGPPRGLRPLSGGVHPPGGGALPVSRSALLLQDEYDPL